MEDNAPHKRHAASAAKSQQSDAGFLSNEAQALEAAEAFFRLWQGTLKSAAKITAPSDLGTLQNGLSLNQDHERP